VRTALYICYFSLKDPLTRTQVVAYLAGLRRRGFRIHLLTFEPHHVTAEDQKMWRGELARQGLEWSCLRYHNRPPLVATLYDVLRGALWIARFARRNHLGLLHGRSHVGAAIARLARPWVNVPYVFDFRGLLADEYVDAGHWSRAGLGYRITKRAERSLLRSADAVVVLTRALRDELRERALAGQGQHPLVVIPCAVDTAASAASREEREGRRRQLGWTGRRVIVYVGKLGGAYLVEEMAGLFAALRRNAPQSIFRVATQSRPDEILNALAREGLTPADVEIGSVPPADMPGLLSAADGSVILYRVGESLRGRYPTKLGEYLAAGLPVITSPLAADCEELLRERRVGTVLHSFEQRALDAGAGELLALMDDPGIRARCQAAAQEELSLSDVGLPRYAALYEHFLGAPDVDTDSRSAS
jgi:glycosyltransferase involved in cell wall biosynthesis